MRGASDQRDRDAANEFTLSRTIPEWAPRYLAFPGRPKYDSEEERARRWAAMRLAGSDSAVDRADRAMAMSYQESYLRQVRALVYDFDDFLQTQRTRDQRKDWNESLRIFVFDRLTRSRLTVASTAVGWVTMLAGRLPIPLSKKMFLTILRSLAHASLLRPARRVRGRWAEAKKAVEDKMLQKSVGGRQIWAAITIMLSGARRPDAVRVVAGEADDHEKIEDTVICFPRTEKTDMIGAREIEPLVIACATTAEASKLFSIISNGPFPDANQLERKVSDHLHQHGVEDIRAVRRDAAARCGSREKAGVLLRHQPQSKHTTRYATTRDRIEPLRLLTRRIHNEDGS